MCKQEFKVITYSTHEEGYCHWSKGLKMILTKGNQRIEIEEKEIKEIVSSLPRTIGGSY